MLQGGDMFWWQIVIISSVVIHKLLGLSKWLQGDDLFTFIV